MAEENNVTPEPKVSVTKENNTKSNENVMRSITISKLTLNIGSGKSEDMLKKGLKLLAKISPVKPMKTTTQKRIPGWSLRPGLAIGAKATIRKNTTQILKKLLAARSNISGGMFVSASGGLAYAAPINTLYPIGIALPGVDVASGGTVNVITHGVAAVVAEATCAVGQAVIMGAGAAQNTVLPADTSSGLRLFGVLQAAGSEGTTFITL